MSAVTSPISSVDNNFLVNIIDDETVEAVVLATHTYYNNLVWSFFASPVTVPRVLLSFNQL